MKIKIKKELLEDFAGSLYNNIDNLKKGINEKTMAITALEAVDDSPIVSESLKSLSDHALDLHKISLLLYQIREQLKDNKEEEIEIDIGNNVDHLVYYLNDTVSILIQDLNDSLYKLQTHLYKDGQNKTKNLSIANMSGRLKDVSDAISYISGILETLYSEN